MRSIASFPLRAVLSRCASCVRRSAAAANAGLDAARGEWLNPLDDDDAFLPHHVDTLRNALAQHSDARLAHARSASIETAGGYKEFGSAFKPWRQLDTAFFHSQAALFARSLAAEGARFDRRFEILEDMDFFLQCAKRTRFVHVEEVTSVSYRDAGTSGTGRNATNPASTRRLRNYARSGPY